MATVGNNVSNINLAEISIGNPMQVSPAYASKSGLTVPVTLNAVTTNNNGYIAGADGTVIKFNTSLLRWENQITNSNTQLNTISASGSTIVAAGNKGAATGGFDDIVYNTGSGWNKVANSVDDYYGSKIVGNTIYFTGANRKISYSALAPTTPQTVLSGTGVGTEKLLGITSAASGSVNVVGEAGLIYYGTSTLSVAQQGNINPPILNDVKWFDNTHVIAVGNTGQIIVSDNAGVNWKVIPPSTGNTFNSVEILNANTAIVAGNSNTLYQVSFTCVGPVCTYVSSAYSPAPSPPLSGNYTDVSIKNNNILLIDNMGYVYYKPNAAAWLTPLNTSVTGLKSVHMVDNTFAFAVGTSLARVRLNPAANTFVVPSPGTISGPALTSNLTSVLFNDYLTGYAVGSNGGVIKTTNSGNTWNQPGSPSTITSTNNINVIAQGPNNSLVLGSSGGGSGNAIDNSDEMSSRFYYDKLGRLVASQNSKQYAKNPLTYSYTRYDNLGRIYEVGEVLASSAIESLSNTNNAQVDLTAFNTWLTTGTFTEITKTYYSVQAAIPTSPSANYYDGAGTFTQANLRNRVSYTTYQDVASATAFDHATYYSYDVHGNVSSLYQFNKNLPAGNKYKRVDYEYDLISGKVNYVYYQKGAKDQFSHQYFYDDDNRITNVYTSKDRVIWDQDAKYFYYRHGPLARTEIGDNKVQGMDYAYTIQGWIKGVNSEKLSWFNDQAKDAMTFTATANTLNNFVSKDAMGYHLGYFNGDYISIVPGSASPTTYFLADKSGSPINPTTVKSLYNGNISEAGYSIKKLIDSPPAGNPYHGAIYEYDQLNRLVATANFNAFDATNNRYTTPTNANAYNEAFTYDANGNILTLQRKDNAGGMMDNLTYNYKNIASGNIKNTNQLTSVDDATTTAITDDIEDQLANNYAYDNIGNLIKDDKENITNIEWTVYGKIKKITRAVVTGAGSDLEFMYDASGNRICKIEKTKTGAGVLNPQSQWNYTYYTRDAQGNTMSTYQVNALASPDLFLTEQHLYGSSRLGVLTRSEDMVITSPATDVYERHAGNKGFEFSNHLGNVLTVVSDRKLFVDDGVYNTSGLSVSTSTDGIIDYYTPDILSATDYYAFGSPTPGRVILPSIDYRYGFQGSEKNNEIKGIGNSLTTFFRELDTRLARWYSIDPETKITPFESPYISMGNTPIWHNDVLGNHDDKPRKNNPNSPEKKGGTEKFHNMKVETDKKNTEKNTPQENKSNLNQMINNSNNALDLFSGVAEATTDALKDISKKPGNFVFAQYNHSFGYARRISDLNEITADYRIVDALDEIPKDFVGFVAVKETKSLLQVTKAGVSCLGTLAGVISYGNDCVNYAENKISGERFAFKSTGFFGSIAVGAAVGGPAGAAVGLGFTAAEMSYDVGKKYLNKLAEWNTITENALSNGWIPSDPMQLFSDSTLKQDITVAANDSLATKMRNLKVYSYNYTSDEKYGYTNKDIGLLAQELERLLPNCVHTVNGVKAIDYTRLIPIMIADLNKKDKDIEELKQLINKLLQKLESQQNENKPKK